MSEARVLSEAEQKRLQRMERTRANRRGRTNPAIMPSKLARTSAFTPKRTGLITDANFVRVYAVEGHSVIEVRGRELGSQHRDVLYSIFRQRARRIECPNPNYNPNCRGVGLAAESPTITFLQVECTWRDLLIATGRLQHVNNLTTMLSLMEEIRQVQFRVYKGNYDQYSRQTARGRLADAGFSDNLLGIVEWDGVNLDSTVRVRYGEWVKKMFEIKNLISMNADVYFGLKSDYAKSFWPFIDSQPLYTYIDEDKLAELAGRDFTGGTWRTRGKFREECRQAFEDMEAAGGIASWRVEQMGSGRVKRHRYHYVHALPRDAERQLALMFDDKAEVA